MSSATTESTVQEPLDPERGRVRARAWLERCARSSLTTG
jgi:hypothetical protein